MVINPEDNSITYNMDTLKTVEQAVKEIEKTVLSSDDISSDIAKSIMMDLSCICNCLSFRPVVRRHAKFEAD